MLFLSARESAAWSRAAEEIIAKKLPPKDVPAEVRPSLAPAFRYYAGSFLAAKGQGTLGKEWMAAGVRDEEAAVGMNTFLSAFLERHQDRFEMPVTVFADPRPYIHFTTIPFFHKSRQNFVAQAARSLPNFKRPLRIMDIGTGNGGLLVMLLKGLQAAGNIADIGEILLIDPFPAMLDVARETVSKPFPSAPIRTLEARIENTADSIEGHYDVALMSLSYHHIPIEKKRAGLRALRSRADHFLLFELDANHDTPEMHSPELALSIYQSYGPMIDAIFEHDAPVPVVQACVDNFLMTEMISMMTQPRGKRTEYHMLVRQWDELFAECLGPEFSRLANVSCHFQDNMNVFMMHYGK